MTGPSVKRAVSVALVHALFVSVFLAVVVFLRSFKPEAAGYEQKGPVLVLYHFARLGLVGFITIVTYTAGYRFLELLRFDHPRLFGDARKTFILSFFFGASLYGVAFALLGLFGLINLPTGLAFTIPMLLLSHRPLRELIAGADESERRPLSNDPYASPRFVRVVMLLAGATGLAFLITRVVYIPVFDPNIWEHYVHYYRAVLASGSTQPNEVWHHFYASKGAGLILLTNVLSDFFGAQVVSACFILGSGVIIADLLLEYCRSTSWAFFGVILFFSFLAGQVADGATFKHHGVLVGYASLALWGSVWLQRATARQFRPLMIVLVVSLGYLGFYLPGAAATFPLAFVLVPLANVLLGARSHLYSLLVLAGALCTGAAVAFLTNWILTGLAEVTPMRWLWMIADRARVEEVFGTGGVEFFLAMNNDLRREYDWSFQRMWELLRYPLPPVVVYLTLLGALILLIRDRRRGSVGVSDRLLAHLAAFVLPLSAFAQAVQTAAVDRMALYSIVFTAPAIVIALKRLFDTAMGWTIRTWPVAAIVRLERRSVHGAEGRRFWRVAFVVIILCGMGGAIVEAWDEVGRRRRAVIAGYVSGAMSLRDAFDRVESRTRSGRVGIKASAMAKFRETIDPDERILRVTYDAGFSYALPGAGVVSEPTYALVRNPRQLQAARPDEVAAYLKERGIGYFAVNLRSNLFSSVAFTSLFDVREMSKYFSVAYEDGDFFILTWREGAPDRRVPDYLLTLLELKQSGVLHYPFTKRFEGAVTAGPNQLVASMAQFEVVRARFLQELDRVVRTAMLSWVSLETSRALLARVVGVGTEAVSELDPLGPPTRLRSVLDADRDRGHVRLAESVEAHKLRTRFVKVFREAIYKEYIAELGREIAALSMSCDERVPFALNYPAEATCR